MFRRILIPLDGSGIGEAILPQIETILKRKGSEIILLRVAQVQTLPVGPVLDTTSDARAYLSHLEDRLRRRDVRVRSILDVGRPETSILDIAEREHVTLIVMATHGRTGQARLVFGNVAEKVVGASNIPLLLLRSFQEGGSPTPSEALTFDRVLVPFSHFDQIVGPIRELAVHFASKVTVLHVQEPDEKGSALDQVRAKIRHIQRDLEMAGIPTETRERCGDPAMEILECAREEFASLIAMTTRGGTGPSKWMLGSVTEKVLKASTTPMLMVRH